MGSSHTGRYCMSPAGLLHTAMPFRHPPLYPTSITGEPIPRTFVTTATGYYSFLTSCLIFTSHAFKFSVLIAFFSSTLPPTLRHQYLVTRNDNLTTHDSVIVFLLCSLHCCTGTLSARAAQATATYDRLLYRNGDSQIYNRFPAESGRN
jgi:hypothetical protein